MPGLAIRSLPGLAELRGLALSVGPKAGWLITAAFSSFGPGDHAADYAFYPWPLPEISPAPAGRLSVPQILPEMPRWDVTGNQDGELVLVYEVNGGATRSIHRRTLAGDPPEPVDPKDPASEPTFIEEPGGGRTGILTGEQLAAGSPQATPGGFNRPRLVRGGETDTGAFTALSDEGILQRFGPGEPTAVRAVPGELEEGWLVAVPDGYTVVLRRPALGTTQPDTHAPPGELYVQRLGRDFEAVSEPRRLLADDTIYELAVDVCDEVLVILATTQRGSLLLIGSAVPSDLPWRRFAIHSGVETVGLPAIACVGQTIHLAFLLAPRTAGARLVTGELPLDDPGLAGRKGQEE